MTRRITQWSMAQKKNFLEDVVSNPDIAISTLAYANEINYRTAWGWAKAAGLMRERKYVWRKHAA